MLHPSAVSKRVERLPRMEGGVSASLRGDKGVLETRLPDRLPPDSGRKPAQKQPGVQSQMRPATSRQALPNTARTARHAVRPLSLQIEGV